MPIGNQPPFEKSPSRQPPAARWPPMSFLVSWRHVVVFSAGKRQNQRFGAGEEEVVTLEAAKGFLRPGLLLVAMELNSFKMPFCAPPELPRIVNFGVFAPFFRQDDRDYRYTPKDAGATASWLVVWNGASPVFQPLVQQERVAFTQNAIGRQLSRIRATAFRC